MSLHKAIAHLKEHRKAWNDSRDFDSSRRNHKGCPWCFGNRMAQRRRLDLAAKAELDLMNEKEETCAPTA